MNTVILVFLLVFMNATAVLAQETTITYQGRLSRAGLPANGSYDFQFSLYGSELTGTQTGEVQTHNALQVSGGEFRALMDFGAPAFDGSERWLQVAVRTNGGGDFEILQPRQRISSTPYAIRALEASALPAMSVTSDMLADGSVTAEKLSTNALAGAGGWLNTYSNTAQSRLESTNSALVTRIGANIFNVQSYGAVGNGVADDSAAIRAAWSAMTNTGHGRLYFPAGTYADTNCYVLGHTHAIFDPGYQGSAYEITGDGVGASTWLAQITDATFLNVTGGQALHFDSITIRNGGGGTNTGFRSDTTGNMYVRNTAFDGWNGVGCDVALLAGGIISGAEFSRCGIGLRLPGYADGWNINAGIHRNIVGVMIGGTSTNPVVAGVMRASGVRVHVSGHMNAYGVVVGGRSTSTYISGYLEVSTNALVAIGFPPGFEVPPDFAVPHEGYVGPVIVENLNGVQHAGTELASTIKVYATNVNSLIVRNVGYLSGVAVELMNAIVETNIAIDIQGAQRGAIKLSDGNLVGAASVGRADKRTTWNVFEEHFSFRDRTNAYFSSNPTGQLKVYGRISATPFAADLVPQTMLYSFVPGAESADLYIGGGTGSGKPYKTIRFHTGTPSAAGAGTLSGMIDATGFRGSGASLTNIPVGGVSGLSSALQYLSNTVTGNLQPSLPPADPNTIRGWASFTNASGVIYKLPLYQ